MSAPKALLLAAGTGSRLRPLTDVLPKCLMPINGRPLLGIWLEMLRRAGVTEAIVNLHHHPELVRRYVERSPYGASVTLAHEEVLLGTAGTLLRHRGALAGGPILFVHADNLSAFDVTRFLQAHYARPPHVLVTMMTFTTDAPERCGIVTLDDRGGIADFQEKPPRPKGNLANAAVYIIEPALFAELDRFESAPVDFSTDVLPRILDRVQTFHNGVYHRDIGTPESLARAQFDYFAIPAAAAVAQLAGDPWYGMMTEDGGRLAGEFARVVDLAYPSH